MKLQKHTRAIKLQINNILEYTAQNEKRKIQKRINTYEMNRNLFYHIWTFYLFNVMCYLKKAI